MGKSLKQDELKKLFYPEPGEVYHVPDPEVAMNRNKSKAEANKPRTVLIVSTSELLSLKNNPHYNIIPLTTKGNPDKLSFPIDKKYSDTADDFKPDKNSLALLPLYQPIKKEIFNSRCGKLEDECYRAIVYALCVNVIGYDDYDLEP